MKFKNDAAEYVTELDFILSLASLFHFLIKY